MQRDEKTGFLIIERENGDIPKEFQDFEGLMIRYTEVGETYSLIEISDNYYNNGCRKSKHLMRIELKDKKKINAELFKKEVLAKYSEMVDEAFLQETAIDEELLKFLV